MESDLFPIPEHQERSRAFTDAALALRPKIEELGMILENVIQESGVLGDSITDAARPAPASRKFWIDREKKKQSEGFWRDIDSAASAIATSSYDLRGKEIIDNLLLYAKIFNVIILA